MKYLRAFIAGLAFPATLLPIVYAVLYSFDIGPVRSLPMQFMPILFPLMFGLWNVLCFSMFRPILGKHKSLRLWISGIVLGLILAAIGIFRLDLPGLLFNQVGNIKYAYLVVIPLVYGLIWRYIIGYLNKLLRVES